MFPTGSLSNSPRRCITSSCYLSPQEKIYAQTLLSPVFQGRLQLDPAALGESLRTETDYARLYGVKLTFDIQAR